MSILDLFKKNRYFLFLMVVLGLLNSLLYSSLLFLINNGVQEEKDLSMLEQNETSIFFVVVVVSFLAARFFQNYLMRFSKAILYDFTISVLNKIRFAGLEAFQQLGHQRIYTAIGDTRMVADLPRFFVEASNQTVMVICGLGYLFWTAPVAMLLTVAVTGFLVMIYWIRNKVIVRDLNALRDLEDEFFRLLGDLLHGFREIKMSVSRNDNLFSKYLERNRSKVMELDVSTSIKYLDNNLLASYGWFLVLGAVIFVLPMFQSIDFAQRTTFVIVILYLMTPISFVINSFDFISRFRVAQSRLIEFNEKLTDISTVSDHGKALGIDAFESIRLEDVYYTYKEHRGDRQFTLGPVNLTINKGETVFVVGENGSGKSTFMMLLAGLYNLQEGKLWVNDVLITKDNLAYYRNLMCSIFTDAHLFSEHYDEYNITDAYDQWQDLIELMRLKGIVEVDNLKKIANPNLSKGQQKRLLMMYALMENKELVLLDEWAAEQDPSFRAIFYNEVLPHLKATGKTVIAITHDDRYFHHADRLILFHDGKMSIEAGAKSNDTLECV